MLSIAEETPDQEDVARLFRLSDEYSRSLYPPESNHLVDAGRLRQSNAVFLVARWNARVVGCGALVVNPAGATAELKRMFVDPSARGRGVARKLLERIEGKATSLGVDHILLETGIHNAEALALYRRCGYRDRGPFGSYGSGPLSVFMEKEIATPASAPTGA
ncbi:MAG: GNAT family N-acetyltransferase [Alphaproteobacteria bacterium]|nr:GNAT family N-acetyltransferase [Alphaproteobacteria bacterium]